ncbi:armadillo repeat-containing protein 8 [Citrus sinensis]|uniref:Armadillo repeat-containing protein 8 n=1 Tax=Citrus sinensis TaxID=2711 RepID=A0ACB8MV94_CITSI|nr:armadillo repeat-containing protein 8 [Citrus sinensis]KAH9789813.1 armadillo repeat-containing protein 8 [Citrus sinensis]
MPTTTASAVCTTVGNNILLRLTSGERDVKLKALRELKNQIIGNRTKKLSFLKLGAVPAVAGILSDAVSAVDVADNDENDRIVKDIIVQSAAVLGSFACGFEAGVRAVLDAGADILIQRGCLVEEMPLLKSYMEVVDAGARSLKMIYQSKMAPKYDFLQEENMEFLLSLLNNESENVSGLGASIISHSCKTSLEQKLLFDAGVLKRLTSLLGGSLIQRDASLESIATIFKNNPEVVSQFVGPDTGRTLSCIIEIVKDRFARTRLLASLCLIVIRNASPCYLQDVGIKTKLINNLLELLDDPGRVGDEASFAFSSLIAEKEDMQKLAFEVNGVDKLYNHLQKGSLHPRRFEGILLALADMCSKLECCRSRCLSLQVLKLVVDALAHDSSDVRSAACMCLRSVSRSIKFIQNLSAGSFMNETIVIPLVRLLDDTSTAVQVAALGAISNIVVDFTTRRSTFIRLGGVKLLVQLSKSMDSTIRLNALRALRNLIFLAEDKCKEEIFMELTASLLASLICDPEPSVQEQALALVRNLVDGRINSVEYIFAEDGIILDAVGRQLRIASKAEIEIQGMYVLGNVATGKESHKEAVMDQLLLRAENKAQSCIIKFLQSNDSRLRTAAVWAVLNLTCSSSPGSSGRLVKLHDAGIVSHVKNMVNDPCLDVKLRVKTALEQFNSFDDSLASTSCLQFLTVRAVGELSHVVDPSSKEEESIANYFRFSMKKNKKKKSTRTVKFCFDVPADSL